MSQEHKSAASIEEIKQFQVAQIELPETLTGAFRIARTVARGDFFLMGSAVRKCVLDEPKLSGDIDFMGDFDLDHVQRQFGQQFIRRWEQFQTVKVGWNGNKIDFIASPRIKKTLAGGDITLSLMCIDQNGYVYDPFVKHPIL